MDDFTNTVEQARDIEERTLVKLDEIIEMYVRIRKYHHKRKCVYSKMITALNKGRTMEAGDIYRNEMPKPLKYKL